eukprot:Em0023g572a
MTNSAPRWGLPIALYVQACLIALAFAWTVVGIILSYGPCINCVLARATLLLSYATIVWNLLVMLGVVFYLRVVKADTLWLLFRLPWNVKKYNWLIGSRETLQTHGRRVSRVSKGSLAQHLRQKTWQWKLKFLFNCLKLDDEKRHTVYSELSDALIELFSQSNSNDYVASDVVAGLELLAMAEETPEELPKTLVDFNNDATRIELVQMERYLRFANGSYGWPQFFHSEGWCRASNFVYKHCRCFKRSENLNADAGKDVVLGDNRCRWNTEILKQLTGIQDADIIYASFLSEDILANLSAHPSLLITAGSLDIYAHKDYNLVIVGHSFGAGVASLLAIILRPRYPRLHCYAFAPPGGLINIESVYYTRTFITTIVIGNDMVPRLSQKSFETLSEKVDYYIQTCSVPKYRVFLSSLLRQLGIHRWAIHSEVTDQLSSEDSLAASEEEVIFERMLTHEKSVDNTVPGVGHQEDVMQKTDREIDKDKPSAQTQLFLAGKIIHVTWEPIARTRLGCWQKQKKERALVGNWVPPTNFSELCIGEDMFSHHLPDVMLEVFDELLAQEKLLAVKT